MKEFIKDEDLVLYVNEQLPLQEKKNLEVYATVNNETDLLLNCILANYASQKDYADELLGDDVFANNLNTQTQTIGQFSMPIVADKKK